MAEVAHSRGVHCQSQIIARINALLVVDGPARLNHGCHACFGGQLHTIGEGKERVGCHA